MIPIVLISFASIYVLIKRLEGQHQAMKDRLEARLEHQKRAIAAHQRHINHLSRDVRDMRADIGWRDIPALELVPRNHDHDT